MTFETWMLYRELSESTIKKYDGAISGVLSEWAMEAGLTSGPLTAITSKTQFNRLIEHMYELPIFQERNERGHKMYSNALGRYMEFITEGFEADVEEDIEQIISSDKVSETEKQNLIKIRIGQGTFRQKLIGYWKCCAVTGYQDTLLLVASHIKPWCVSSNSERLDCFNGLLLLPNIDSVFDKGFITFNERGEILISPLLSSPELLGINEKMKLKLSAQHQIYMQFHRENVFRGN